MPRLSLFTAIACSAVLFSAAAGPAAADHHKSAAKEAGEWVEMFDGKSLDGWTKAGENEDSITFDAEKEAIKTNGPRCHLFYTAAEKPFRDFEFQAKVMTLPNSNGGIYFHTRYQDTAWPAGGFECQVNNSYEKDPRKTGSLYQVVDVRQPPAGDEEWFDYSIRVDGKHVTVTVNGRIVADYTEPIGARPGSKFDRVLGAGTFALQAHDPGSTVYYKDLKVRRLLSKK